MKGRNNKKSKEAYVRFARTLERSKNVTDKSNKNLGLQFAYFMANKDGKKRILQDHKKFKPLRIPKMTSKFIRLGRLC